MTEPLSARSIDDLEDLDLSAEGLVWAAALDGRFLCEVHRYDETDAALFVFDMEQDIVCIYEESVVLSGGALFGPDVADVGEWQEQVIEFIDNEYDK